ncbi:AAA family ATPase [Phosphitispora fastidiosa]|uniref:AAA family ATPase n=1 Tax=Phosphitispora fastidiosa TaxID=2837202 RepID=UPI001E2B1B3C|nr:AAA family ATPase [Phosphitispora fastidiosa]MBU7005474.1 putative ATPase [Phosphitispora fastidiosa]
MKIEGLRLKNFKIFKDLRLVNLPDMVVFLGANGSGKSTLFDAFGFLHDSLIDNVRAALTKRGGFKEVVSRDQQGPIEFEIKFRPEPGEPLVTYELHIGLDCSGLPVVSREVLKYRRGQQGAPWHFLDFSNGSGTAIVNESEYGRLGVKEEREEQKLDSPDILAIKGLGQFQKFKQVAAFRRLIEGWHVSDFHVQAARASADAGYAEHLSPTGENLPLVAQFMYQHYPEKFKQILRKMEYRVPGIKSVEAVETPDGRIVLRFQDGSFKDPFVARYVSDGTIKMFAYLLLLNDPKPHPLLCIEEPENQLHPELLFELAEEFRAYTRAGGQVFISTHSPDFVNGVELNELFWLTKSDGYSEVKRASDDELLRNLVVEGDLPGALWKQGFFEGAGPQ